MRENRKFDRSPAQRVQSKEEMRQTWNTPKWEEFGDFGRRGEKAGYSPTWIDGKKHARNVYAHTREECEEKLKVLIAEMKAELAELKRQKGDRH